MDVSIVTNTYLNHNDLIRCLIQGKSQQTSVKYEHIVLSDEIDPVARKISEHYGARYYEFPHEGKRGAHLKDKGIELAEGAYIVFWDDDNIFYPNYLATLCRISHGYDIGMASILLRPFDLTDNKKHYIQNLNLYEKIPYVWKGHFEHCQVDTMSVCVKKTIAERAKWADFNGYEIDYVWLSKLQGTINFEDSVVGIHL